MYRSFIPKKNDNVYFPPPEIYPVCGVGIREASRRLGYKNNNSVTKKIKSNSIEHYRINGRPFIPEKVITAKLLGENNVPAIKITYGVKYMEDLFFTNGEYFFEYMTKYYSDKGSYSDQDTNGHIKLKPYIEKTTVKVTPWENTRIPANLFINNHLAVLIDLTIRIFTYNEGCFNEDLLSDTPLVVSQDSDILKSISELFFSGDFDGIKDLVKSKPKKNSKRPFI